MKRLWRISAWVIAALALSATVPSMATAHYWMVNGKMLATSKAHGKEVELVSNSPIIFTLKTTPAVQVECETLEFANEKSHAMIWNEAKGSEAVGRDEGRNSATKCRNLTITSCKVVEPLTTDNTSEVSTTLVEEETTKKIYDMFLPEKWEEGTSALSETELLFSTFNETGTGCPTNVPITGDGLAAKISNEGEELVEHTIQLPGEATNCKPKGAPLSPVIMANGNRITLFYKGSHISAQECGEATVRLLSKENWSVK